MCCCSTSERGVEEVRTFEDLGRLRRQQLWTRHRSPSFFSLLDGARSRSRSSRRAVRRGGVERNVHADAEFQPAREALGRAARQAAGRQRRYPPPLPARHHLFARRRRTGSGCDLRRDRCRPRPGRKPAGVVAARHSNHVVAVPGGPAGGPFSGDSGDRTCACASTCNCDCQQPGRNGSAAGRLFIARSPAFPVRPPRRPSRSGAAASGGAHPPDRTTSPPRSWRRRCQSDS